MQQFILTLDCDWAPDFVIESTLAKIEQAGAHATVFVTHPSKSIPSRLVSQSIELGWHPNFHANSTQGRSVPEVVAYLENIVPHAQSVRTHDLFQSTSIFSQLIKSAPRLRNDCSLYLPGQKHISPFDLQLENQIVLRRFPFLWEDDLHLVAKPSFGSRDQEYGNADEKMAMRFKDIPTQGLCMLNFHPIHVYLNTLDFSSYRKVQALGPLTTLTESDLKPYVNLGKGIATLFDQALSELDFSQHLAEFAAADSSGRTHSA